MRSATHRDTSSSCFFLFLSSLSFSTPPFIFIWSIDFCLCVFLFLFFFVLCMNSSQLLSPLILVCSRESQTVSPSSSSSSDTASSSDEKYVFLLSHVLDSRYVEADTYWLFTKMMEIMAPYFAQKQTHTNNNKHKHQQQGKSSSSHLFSDPIRPSPPSLRVSIGMDESDTPMVRKCHYIHHILLSTLDPPLYKHLNQVEVQPNIYVL